MKGVVVALCVVVGVGMALGFDNEALLDDLHNIEQDIRGMEEGHEVFLSSEGDPGQSCKRGVRGICKNPNECSGEKVRGACNGGADNVCCVERNSESASTAPSTPTSQPSTPSTDSGEGELPREGWAPQAFPTPDFTAPSPCPSRPVMPDVERVKTDDATFVSLLDRIAASRSAWSRGRESVANSRASLDRDWTEYSTYIIRRMAMRQTNRNGECTVASYMNQFLPKVKRGFLCAMYNKARFDFLAQNAAASPISRPSGTPETITDSAVGGSEQQKVARCVVNIVKELKTRTRVSAGTYIGHSWGPYSIDFFPSSGTNDCGFYEKDKALAFLDALHNLSRERGFKWRCLYDDYDVAKAFNERYRTRKVSYIKYHGPNPFVLHFHCDFNC